MLSELAGIVLGVCRERDEANARVETLDEALTAALDDRDVFVEREKAANARAAGLVERDKSE